MAFLGGFFGKKQRTIEDLTLDDLTMGKVKLEREQERTMHRLTDLEKQKEALFQEGVAEASKRRQVLLAQRLQELESQAKHYDRTLTSTSYQLRVINGLVFLKENRRSWEDTPLGRVVGKMDLAELESYVDGASSQNDFQMDKFRRMIESIEGADEAVSHEQMDEGVAEILTAFQAARDAGNLTTGLEKLNEALKAETGTTDRQ